ncbi:MAG: phosphotransferase family protein [Fimbriimonadaceae bacterium]
MEEAWVRQGRVATVSLKDAISWLRPHGLKPVALEVLTEGKANTNLKLVLADHSAAVLRVYQRNKSAQRLELALLRHFEGRIPVPQVLADDEHAGWSLLVFVPGRTLQHTAAVGEHEACLAAAPGIGKALAAIAATRFEIAGFLDVTLTVVEPWPSVIDGLEGYLDMCLNRPIVANRVGADFIPTIRQHWLKARPSLETLTANPNLSHGDFKPSNLLVRDGRVCGVLDWEFAHSGTWLLDAGQILRHRAELPANFAVGVEAGLREGGLDVPADWQRLAATIDLVSLVDFLGRPLCTDATVNHILRLIQATLADG